MQAKKNTENNTKQFMFRMQSLDPRIKWESIQKYSHISKRAIW